MQSFSPIFQLIVEVLSSKLLWQFLGDFSPTDFDKYFVSLSKFIILILESSRGQESLLVTAMAQILSTRSFAEFGNHSDINSNEVTPGSWMSVLRQSPVRDKDLLETINELIRLVLKLTPHLVKHFVLIYPK